MQSDTLLLRQIHPHWIRENRVTSVAFRPMQMVERYISVSDSDKISPQDAWKKHTKKYKSEGTMGITVGESDGQRIIVVPDPLVDQDEHVHLDFANLTTSNQRESASKILAVTANQRGWLYKKPE